MLPKNDYVKVVVNGDHLPTVISFSSLHTKRGDFKPYKFVLEEKVNVIFVNCEGNNYYQNGIEGISDVPKVAAEKLVSAGRSIGNGRVVTFGTSMGAYGAILYGILGDADGCFCFGPPIDLKKKGSRSYKFIDQGVEIKYPDLTPLMKESSMHILIYASEHDELDLINTTEVKDFKNVDVFTVRGANHPGIRREVTNGWIGEFASSGSYLADFERKGEMLNRIDIVNFFYDLYCKKDSGDMDGYFDAIRKIPDENNFVVSLKKGELSMHEGDYETAKKHLYNAITFNSYCYEAYDLLSEFPIFTVNERVEYLKKSLSIFPNGETHAKIGKLYYDNGEYTSSEKSYMKALGFAPNNSRYKREYEEVKKKLSANLM